RLLAFGLLALRLRALGVGAGEPLGLGARRLATIRLDLREPLLFLFALRFRALGRFPLGLRALSLGAGDSLGLRARGLLTIRLDLGEALLFLPALRFGALGGFLLGLRALGVGARELLLLLAPPDGLLLRRRFIAFATLGLETRELFLDLAALSGLALGDLALALHALLQLAFARAALEQLQPVLGLPGIDRIGIARDEVADRHDVFGIPQALP